jgi:hypothetical protein
MELTHAPSRCPGAHVACVYEVGRSPSGILSAVRPSRSLENLRRTLYVLAVIPIVAGAATALLGSDSLPGARNPTASIESELRFFSVWWIGAGLFVVWLARRIEERALELRVFCGLLFLGGLSRLLGIFDAGWPSALQIVLMGLELSLPIVLVGWHAKAVATRKAASGPVIDGR